MPILNNIYLTHPISYPRLTSFSVAYKYHVDWIADLTAEKEEWVLWRAIMIVAVIVATVGFVLIMCLVCCILYTSTYRIVAFFAFALWLIVGKYSLVLVICVLIILSVFVS